ncbi:hypothetical protein [Nocardioides humi]|uniref:DUF3352 domain-containing protein n=1 Tax=Nocardioides humi TaxID=449461 RepID=A0ABN2AAX5_9ACTN|nr:hypothetical protein [Nocardioides humi]
MTELAPPVPTPPPAPSRKRRVAAVAGVVGLVAVIGAGTWAWQDWLAQGPQAAEALPGDTLAYVGIDLDPPGGQKLEAYQTLRRFPGLAERLGVKDQDDLRRSLIDGVTADTGCDIGYDDFADWAGDRAALAVVPQDEPELVAVVQVGDAAKARDGLAGAIAGCGEEVGYALGDGWAVLARTEEVARRVVADGRRTHLGEDADFQELTAAAGDAGVLTLYAAPEAGQALLDAAEKEPFLSVFLTMPLGVADPIDMLLTFSSFVGVDTSFDEDLPPIPAEEQALWDRMDDMDQLSPEEQDQLMKDMDAYFAAQADDLDEADLPEISEEDFAIPVSDQVRERLEHFTGLGGVVRLDDGALELEIVADPMFTGAGGRYAGTDALAAVSHLPEDAALAFGGGLADGWAERAITGGPLAFGQEPEALLAEFEKTTGLTPADLEDLGGDTIAFVAAPGFEKTVGIGDGTPAPPIAARITGDAEKVEAALAKVRAALPQDLLSSARSGDAVVIGADRAFVEQLARTKGTLGDSDRFRDAVPDAEGALTIAYLDFDRGDWASTLSDGDLKPADLAPLDTASITTAADGERERVVVRVSFDD